MDFRLTNEQRMILGTVREFVTKELLPLEAAAQRAELDGRSFPGPGDIRRLQQRARTAGARGPLTPEKFGGAHPGMLITPLNSIENAKPLVPFSPRGPPGNIFFSFKAEQ